MRRLTLRVPPSEAGTRLDQFLAARGGISRGRARRALDEGGVFVDGRRCKVASRAVRAGQSIVVNLEEAGKAPDAAAPLERSRLLFADDHIVAVDKPPFVPAQPTLTSDRGTLGEAVEELLGAAVTLVHRLDRETSGVTVFARTRLAADALSEAFRGRAVEKTYLALTARAPLPGAGRIEAPLGPDPARPGRRIVTDRGAPAATRYETVAGDASGPTVVRCWPETGRTHQIRVHLAHAGAPLLGDWRYGGPRRVGDVEIRRVMLHARRLRLEHPATGAALTVEAPLPPDFAAVLTALVPTAAGAPSL